MLPFTILRKHPIVPSKLEIVEDIPLTQKQEDIEEQQQQQQQEDPNMAPNAPEDPGETNFNGEEEEEEGYPETTSLLTPTFTTPTVLPLDSPTWPAPSPPTPIARTPARRDSEASDNGGDVERATTINASGRKIIR